MIVVFLAKERFNVNVLFRELVKKRVRLLGNLLLLFMLLILLVL